MSNKIKFAVFDFDGVFTDGSVYFDHLGNIMKKYNARDGMGLRQLRNANIKIGVISGYKENESQRHILEHLKFDYVSLGSDSKREIIERWIEELGITMKQVSFIGDDINDTEALEHVGFSGCPQDAHKDCLKVADYVSSKKGGEGCVREFCEEILKMNNKKTISGLICVKYNSSRLPQKNMRKFGNTTLLDLKIKKLLSLSFLDEVIVNTESQIIIDYINDNYFNSKLTVVKRDPLYATDLVDNREFARNVVSTIKNEYVLYSPVTMPFIGSDTYLNMYNKMYNDDYDSIILVADGKQGKGHNHEKHNFCFGASIMKVQDVTSFGDFIGDSPYFQECNSKERIDIDYDYEFNTALYHYFNKDAIYGEERDESMAINSLYNLNAISPIADNNSIMPNKRVMVNDVTIRDGGFDNQWNWERNDVLSMLKCASDTGLDYFEIGYLVNDDILKDGDGHYRNVSNGTINDMYNTVKPKCKISVLMDYWRYDIEKLLPSSETKIDLVRLVTYMENDKIMGAIESCRKAKNKGYETSLNIMCGSYFDDAIIENIRDKVLQNKDVLDFLYFADSYGGMEPKDVNYIFSKVQDIRNMGIKIGFHIHNNGQIGMANMIASLDYVDMIDASYNGMGRGMGNVRLEDVVLYLIIKKKYDFKIEHFLNFADNNFNEYQEIIDEIKNTLLGFLNIHPYRMRDFPKSNLFEFYNSLMSLPYDKKYDYKT